MQYFRFLPLAAALSVTSVSGLIRFLYMASFFSSPRPPPGRYIDKLTGLGLRGLGQLRGLQEGQVMAMAQRAGMRPNDAIKFTRRQAALGGGGGEGGGGMRPGATRGQGNAYRTFSN